MRRQRRQRQVVIPAGELGWMVPGMKSRDDDWNVNNDVAERLYGHRQYTRNPKRVDPKLRRAKLKGSVLQTIQPGDNKERKRNWNEWLRTRTLVSDAQLSRLESPKGVPSLALFHREVDELRKEVRKLTVPYWFHKRVVIPLGPDNLERVMHDMPRILTHHRFELLTYNDHNTSFLCIEEHINNAVTKTIVAEAFGPSRSESESFLLAAPNSGFAMDLRYGEEPQYVASPSDTNYAIVYDDIIVPFNELPRECVEKKLNMRVKWTRLVTEQEKRWIEKRVGVEEQIRIKLRIICFYSVEDRRRAEPNLKVLNFLYCPMMFNKAEVYEEVYLNVHYNIRPRHEEGVQVKLTYEADKDFAEEVLRRCSLSCYVVVDDEVDPTNAESKFLPGHRVLDVRDFPPQFRTYEDRRWFLEKILKKNHISIDSMNQQTIESEEAFREAKIAMRRNIKECIDYEILKMAHVANVWRPLNMPWEPDMNGGRGAQFYSRTLMSRPDLPWIAKRHGRGPTKEDEMYSVYFHNIPMAVRLVAEIVDFSSREPVFRCDKLDNVGPLLDPVYRISTAISRQMRVANEATIFEFDKRLRTTFTTLSDNEDPLMETPESLYYSVRIFEEWKHNGDGVIGVEGWNPRGIQHFFAQLQLALRPVEFSTESIPELTCGIGEYYVKYLEKKYENKVVFDVDKFRQIISIFGSIAMEVVEELEKYPQRRTSFQVTTLIPLYFPLFNEAALDVLTPRALLKLANSLGAQCVLDQQAKQIQFTGTIEAYEELTVALASVSSEVYRHYVSPSPVALQCPACFCETDNSSDYYRFHCGHEMCRGCVNNMISARIDEPRMKIKCEAEGCTAYLTPDEILHIILGGMDRLLELDASKLVRTIARAKQALVNVSADIDSCPTADCVGILVRDKTGSTAVSKHCEACRREYCRGCLLEPHVGYTCAQYDQLRIPDVSIAAYIKSVGRDNVKKCPSCEIWVNKVEGCNHLECKCGAHFCWVCLYVADSENDCYAHMRNVHDNYGGQFRMVRGRLQANEPDLQLELDMQRLMLGDEPIDVPPQRPPRDPQFVDADDAPEDFQPPPPPPGLLPFPPGLFPPGLAPPPPPRLTELPIQLIREFPNFFTGNHDFHLRTMIYLNASTSIQDREDRIEELRQFAREN